jgi:uncharacterized membrane protein
VKHVSLIMVLFAECLNEMTYYLMCYMTCEQTCIFIGFMQDNTSLTTFLILIIIIIIIINLYWHYIQINTANKETKQQGVDPLTAVHE